jgi:hypothetical protein
MVNEINSNKKVGRSGRTPQIPVKIYVIGPGESKVNRAETGGNTIVSIEELQSMQVDSV